MPANMTDDPIAFTFFNEIGIIDQLAGALLERALPPGMTRAQFGILNHFVRLGHGECSPAQLASAFQVTRPTMSSTLSRLARSGLVHIRDDPADGRAKLVSITEKGRVARQQALVALGKVLPVLEQLLGADDVAIALPILRRLRIAMDAARD